MKKNLNKVISQEDTPKMITYFYGKFAEAVYILATHPGDIKKRLRASGEKILFVPPNVLPRDVQEDIKWIRGQLTRFAYEGEENNLLDVMRTTLHAIRQSTCVKIAKRIFQVYSKLGDYAEEGFPSGIKRK